ncbi:hypothetical protein TMatcc_009498 [Talaromyces marneffei ATCC 18224]|uniref:Ankyrin repeat-containing protein, putative n=2 Tax=Talaromyces marneffei TaxID=37727 RepID=B6QSL1_TALMQ|nr:uncharacterized protein EYB26_008750 [Talaromyces marneffei]EEA19364.1 ankyrin repeat-containing protein, putative [Talaromyces marneffei ATCC 18224]KAE8547687.1 hypothetical protein EYB25_009480 [Talaromyces marneffei]QGA21040.1 hypothetical protein EYB26_008750 [Talaromyces marneffei]
MGKESTIYIETSLEEAAKHPNPGVFESMLKQLTDSEDKSISEEELLLRASGRGDVAVATQLLQRGTDIEARDSSGWTPLLIAVMQHKTPMVKLLLEYGAEPDVKCHLGIRTPLHQAADGGYEEITELLLTHRANPNLYNDNRRRPLVFAAAEGHLSVVKMLLDHGAYSQTKEDPETPLYWAKRHEYEDIVRLLEPLCKVESKVVEKSDAHAHNKSGGCLVQ